MFSLGSAPMFNNSINKHGEETMKILFFCIVFLFTISTTTVYADSYRIYKDKHNNNHSKSISHTNKHNVKHAYYKKHQNKLNKYKRCKKLHSNRAKYRCLKKYKYRQPHYYAKHYYKNQDVFYIKRGTSSFYVSFSD
jgi:hypothetical protein